MEAKEARCIYCGGRLYDTSGNLVRHWKCPKKPIYSCKTGLKTAIKHK